jgi:hypothetical protein
MNFRSFHDFCDSSLSKAADWVSTHWQKETGLSRILLALWLSRAILCSDIGLSLIEGSAQAGTCVNLIIFEVGLHQMYKTIMRWEESQEESDQVAIHPKIVPLQTVKQIFLFLSYVCSGILILGLPVYLMNHGSSVAFVKLINMTLLPFPIYIVTSPFLPRGKRISSLVPATPELAHESARS